MRLLGRLLLLALAAAPASSQIRIVEPLAPPQAPLSAEPGPEASAPSGPLTELSASPSLEAVPLPASPAPDLTPLHAAPKDEKARPSVSGWVRQVLRTDRPKRPSDKELEGLFDLAHPGTDTVEALNRDGGFSTAASQMVTELSFIPSLYVPQHLGRHKQADEVASVALDAGRPEARRFLEALGRRAAFDAIKYHGRFGSAFAKPALPDNPLGKGEYWDMAAGKNAGDFMVDGELRPGTRYAFFDVHPYILSYLNSLAALLGLDARAVEADILKLERPTEPLAVLRSKNASTYVPGFESKLETMTDWIAPGGRLVIQTDPDMGQLRHTLQIHGPLIRRLLREGWDLSWEFSGLPESRYRLDTIILARPEGLVPPRKGQEADDLWKRLTGSAMYHYARPRLIFFGG